jgi:hypothetical protein
MISIAVELAARLPRGCDKIGAMRRFAVSLSLLAIIIAAGCASSQRERVHHALDPDLAKLQWLAGSWLSQSGATSSEEHWTEPAGGTMLGMNRTIVHGKTVFFEYLRIEKRADAIVYLASPKGQHPPTPFKLAECTQNQATFENPQHDFPQRIIYERNGDELRGRIEGVRNGQAASENWAWRRMPPR